MRYLGVEEMLVELKANHPDKMLLEDGDAFERGKIAGHIENILEIEAMLEREEEEEEDGRES